MSTSSSPSSKFLRCTCIQHPLRRFSENGPRHDDGDVSITRTKADRRSREWSTVNKQCGWLGSSIRANSVHDEALFSPANSRNRGWHYTSRQHRRGRTASTTTDVRHDRNRTRCSPARSIPLFVFERSRAIKQQGRDRKYDGGVFTLH